MSTAELPAIFLRRESEVRGYCRRFPVVFKRAVGSQLEDVEGRRYIDFLAGCGSLNYGHNDPDMSEALVQHLRAQGLSVAMDLHTDVKQRFLEVFTRHVLEPRGLTHRVMFTGPTGTNAIEAAFKLARKVTGRHNIIAFTNGYHGVTLGALAATGNGYNRMGAPLAGVTRMPFDRYFGHGVDTVDMLARMLDDPSSGIDAPAAIVFETVQGEGGLNAASPDWVRRMAALAQRHGALLIIDDVQAGCGRTGRFFSFETMGIDPDLIVLSKSISGFGLPMALLLVRPDRDQWRPAEHNGTFRGNTHAFVTATVAIEKFWADARFEEAIHERSEIVRAGLRRVAERVPDAFLKGRGMMQGLQLSHGELADRISRLAFERGLIVELAGPNDEVLKILAPLTIPKDQLQEGLAILHAATVEAMQADAASLPRMTSACAP